MKAMKRPYAAMVLMTALAGASVAVALPVIEASLLGSATAHGLWRVMVVIWLIGILVVVGATLASIAWVLSARRRVVRPRLRTGSIALEILQRRLAVGAITPDEYEQKRRALEHHTL